MVGIKKVVFKGDVNKKQFKDIMQAPKIIAVIISFVVLSLPNARAAQNRPGDLDNDFKIDTNDLRIFIEQWLDPPGCSGQGCADLDGQNGVDFADFAIFAQNWHKKFDSLIISEFMASNIKTILDGDRNSSDWIEIQNLSGTDILLDGWHLTDNHNNLQKWPFPAGITITGGSSFLVFASGKSVNNYIDPEGYYHTNFSLNKDGEYLAIVRPDGVIAHEYKNYNLGGNQFGYPPQQTDISYGVSTDSTMLISQNADANIVIPADGSMANEWIQTDYTPDFNWFPVKTGVGFTPPIGIEKAGDLLIDLSPYDLGMGEFPQWPNHGTLGGYFHNDGTIVWITTPPPNYISAVHFDGTNRMKSSTGVTAPPAITGDSDWSVEVWALNPAISAQESLVQWVNDVGTEVGTVCYLGYGSSGSSGAIVHHGNPDMGYDGGVPEAGKWHHIVATYEGAPGGTENIYVDGKLNATEHKILNLYKNHSFRLANASGNLYFTGWMAAVRIHSGCLAENQVVNNFISDASYFDAAVPPNLKFMPAYIKTDIFWYMKSVNSSAYLRIEFNIEDVNTLQDTLLLTMYYDDGFIAYLNGHEVASRNAPAEPVWNSTATAQRSQQEAATMEAIDISGFKNLLKTGKNVLAVQGLNWDKDDEDFLISPSLVSFSSNKNSYKQWYFTKPTPCQSNSDAYADIVSDLKFSVERGFYDQPFQVRIATDTPDAAIRYTLDGSSPTETYGSIYDPNNPIQINTTTILRAIAAKSGYKPSAVISHTYIFLDDVINQSYYPDPNKFPPYWDYGMDWTVVHDPNYYPIIKQALKDIPSVCIGISSADFFEPGGVYYEATVRELEKGASMEYIDPATNKTYQANIGIRSHGGVGRSDLKHALRVIAKSQYGPSMLEFPFFKDTEVDKFNSLVLRSTWNYSWIGDSSCCGGLGSSHAQYLRDTFCRDTIRDMDRLAPYGRHVHLYIDGLYWGLYKLVERPDDVFAQEHLGGDKTDYDVLKAPNETTGTPPMDVISGNTLAWDAMNALAQEGQLYLQEKYDQIRQYLDVENLIDYLLMIFQTGNRDAPVLLSNNNIPRNFFTIKKRSPDGKFMFIPWDCEWSLEDVGVIRVNVYGYSNPHFLFQNLMSNNEFRIQFADQVQKRFYNNGALTPQSNIDRYMARAIDIDKAIIGESARWGDDQTYPPYTRNGHWIPERDRLINDYFPIRTDIVIDQLRMYGMFPAFNAPEFYINGQPMHGGQVNSGNQLTMVSSVGTIYYTLDGSDPRTPLTNVPRGIPYTGPINLTKSTYVKARTYDDSQWPYWSGLNEATFAIGSLTSSLRITEIMYHPREWPVIDPNAEFIELKNISAQSINLKWVKFTKGIQFTFPDVTLSAGQYIVVVKDFNAFNSVYGTGLNTVGPYSGNLDNAGERIRLEDAIGRTILDFSYKDNWRDITDGEGYSLTINNENNSDPNSWGKGQYWSASTNVGGTPCQGDAGPRYGDIVINEVLAHSHATASDWIELHNTTGHSIDITGWFLSDSDANLTKYQIPSAAIPANGYIVFTEADHFGPYFALSENGDQVNLSSGYNGQVTGYRFKEEFGASESNVAFGRYYKADTDSYNFVPMSTNTPGQANAYPKVGPIVISEIMYHPEKFWGDWNAEYIELYNITDQAVNLFDVNGISWKFTDGIDFTFPPYTTLPSHTPLLVVKKLSAFNSEFTAPPGVQKFEWTSGGLDNGGEKIELSMPGDIDENGEMQYIRVDRVTYSDGSHPENFDGLTDPWPTDADGLGKSLQIIDPNHYGNDPNNWQAANPKPGTVQLPGGWTLLTYDDFEAGGGNYTSGGENAKVLTTTYAHQGTKAADIESANGDVSSFWHTSPIDVHTPNYTQIKVDFWYYPVSMETGEDFWVMYYDGSTWKTIKQFVSGTDFSNNQFYHSILLINEGTGSGYYNFPTDMKIKFRCNASHTNDDVYIDEIVVSAK
jgi:hypothetical protein